MERCEIDDLFILAKQRNIEISAITLRAANYDALVVELAPSARYPGGEMMNLTYKGVIIHRRKCVGCCQHG